MLNHLQENEMFAEWLALVDSPDEYYTGKFFIAY